MIPSSAVVSLPSSSSVAARIFDDFGVTVRLGCELEFYLEPPPDRPAELVASWVDKLAGHPLFRSFEQENGEGQFEVTTHASHDPEAVLSALAGLKTALAGLAAEQGCIVNALSQPYGARPGSAFHVHVSLHDGAGRNLFRDLGDKAESPWLTQAVNGLLSTLTPLMLVFAPTRNCFERYREMPYPSVAFAPSRVCWGPDNRAAAVRLVSSVAAPQVRRLEHRVAGASSDAASVLSAILIAIHAGLSAGAPLGHRPINGIPKSGCG